MTIEYGGFSRRPKAPLRATENLWKIAEDGGGGGQKPTSSENLAKRKLQNSKERHRSRNPEKRGAVAEMKKELKARPEDCIRTGIRKTVEGNRATNMKAQQ